MFVSFPLWAFRLEMWNDHHALGMGLGVWLSSIRALGYDFVGNLFYITLGINEWCTGFENLKKLVKILVKYRLSVVVEMKLAVDWLDEKSPKKQWNWQYFKKLSIFWRNYVRKDMYVWKRRRLNNHKKIGDFLKKIVDIPPIFQRFFFKWIFWWFFQKANFQKKKLSMFFWLFFFQFIFILNLYHPLFYIILLFLIIFVFISLIIF